MIPVELNKIYEIKTTGIGSSGEGVGRFNMFTIFVDGALPGEVVKTKIIEVKKNYAVGELLEIVKASVERVEPKCPKFFNAECLVNAELKSLSNSAFRLPNSALTCGGCQLQHLSYTAQLKWKHQQVIDALQRIGGLDVDVKETIGMSYAWRYRNKMQFPVSRVKNQIQIGCFAKSSHKVIDTDSCLIQRQENDQMLQAARKVIEKFNLPVYDEDRHRGVIRHIMGRVGVNAQNSIETMLVLVTTTEKLPSEKSIVRALRNELPNVTSIQQNIQPQRNNVILGRETKLLYGKRTIKDTIGGLEFSISARSFFQVNTVQAEKLYQTALEFADLQGDEIVVDAYCGTGTITLFLARHAKKVYGLEIVPTAIADAKVNARENNIRNAEFIVGDASIMLPNLGVKPDVIVLDPPRAGCDEKILRTISKLRPSKVVYVSCNPATLARDLKFLQGAGFSTKIVQPVDMFPFTSHVESVVLLKSI